MFCLIQRFFVQRYGSRSSRDVTITQIFRELSSVLRKSKEVEIHTVAYIWDDARNITRRMSGEIDEEYRVPPPHPRIDDAPRSVSKIDKIFDVIGSWESQFQKLLAIERMQAKLIK